MAVTAASVADFDGDGLLDLAVFEGVESGLLDDDDLRQAVELIEPGTPLGWFCTRTRGRARSSQPCGEPAPRSSPADAFPPTKCWPRWTRLNPPTSVPSSRRDEEKG